MQNLYDQLGSEGFAKLARVFYQGVAGDPLLKPMYPEEDLAPAERRLKLFLEQYWGGPDTYQQERGHPRLRMRHMPFTIGPKARDAWLSHMRAALDSLELSPADDALVWDYLERAAHAMLNTFQD
jgi:hemoglobin